MIIPAYKLVQSFSIELNGKVLTKEFHLKMHLFLLGLFLVSPCSVTHLHYYFTGESFSNFLAYNIMPRYLC